MTEYRISSDCVIRKHRVEVRCEWCRASAEVVEYRGGSEHNLLTKAPAGWLLYGRNDQYDHDYDGLEAGFCSEECLDASALVREVERFRRLGPIIPRTVPRGEELSLTVREFQDRTQREAEEAAKKSVPGDEAARKRFGADVFERLAAAEALRKNHPTFHVDPKHGSDSGDGRSATSFATFKELKRRLDDPNAVVTRHGPKDFSIDIVVLPDSGKDPT